MYSVRKRQSEATASHEASSSSRGGTKAAKLSEEEGATAVVNQDSRFTHRNQPTVVSVYKDHVTAQEKVNTLPFGASDARFRLLGSRPGNRLAVVDYAWPPIAYEIDELFGEEIRSGEMAACDPRIAALKDDVKLTR